MATIGKGVEEIRVRDAAGIYRVIYTARIVDAVYVLHAFQKKSQATSRQDIEIATERYAELTRSKKMTRQKVESYASVWDAIADTPEQAANLRARAELMQQIAAIVTENGWTQAEAAAQCGVTQPRMSDLLRGCVSNFSLDALVNIATSIGRRVHVELLAA